MRKKGETSVMCAGKSAIPPDEVMISPLPSKVNNPLHLADFADHRDCPAVEAAPCEVNCEPRKAPSIEQLPGAGLGAVRGKDLASRSSVKVSTFDQFSARAATYHPCQRTSLASLGGSHGKLRRVDAKAA